MKRSRDKCIVIFTAYMPPHVGGIERYTSNLVKQFVKLGYKPILVVANYNNDKEFEDVNSIVTIRLPIYNIFKNRYPIVKLNKKKRELMALLDNYDIVSIIVNTRFYFTSHIGVRYAKKHDIPVYLIEHGSTYVTLDNKFIDFFANRYEDFLTFCLKKNVDGFYGASEASSQWLRKFGIMASGTWSNSIDFDTDTVVKKKHKEINFLYAGRIIKQKGVYNILVSFCNLAKKYDNIHLYIAGDGPELDKYKNDFIHDRIHFLGKINFDELLNYYAKCDVFLYPPLWPEALPTSILEAAMTRCAVIATDQGGIKEIISDGNTGIIVGENVDDLSNGMERLILDENLRKKIADNLYSIAKNKFSWEVTAKNVLKDMDLKE